MASTDTVRTLHFWRELWLLGRLRWHLCVNGTRTYYTRSFGRVVLFGMLALLFLVADYAGSVYFMRHILFIPGGLGTLLMTQLLSMLCLTFFSMLIFSNTIASLSTIYLSSDLLLLMSAPLRLTPIFVMKFCQTLLYSSWMVLLCGLPILLAFGYVTAAPLTYYLWLGPILLPFLVIPAGLGILCTMLLMRYFPAKQTHKALTLLSVCFMGGVVMFIRFLRPERLVREAPDAIIQQFLESIKTPDLPLLPSSWAAKALLTGSTILPGNMLSHVGLLWGGAVLVFGLAIWIAGRVYYTGWAGGAIATRTKPLRPTWQLERVFLPCLAWCAPTTRGLLMKDLKLFFRDPAQWSQLLLLGALVVIYLYNIQNLPLNTVFLQNLITVLNLGLAGFVLSAVAVRFVFTSTSLEGRSFWLIMASPIALRAFIREKFCMYIVPLLLLAETLVIVSNVLLKADTYLMLFAIVTILLMTCGLTGLGVGLGAMYPHFEYDNIAQTAASAGGVLYMVLSLAFIGAILGLAARPLYVHLSAKFLYQHHGGGEVYLCYAAIGVVCLGTTLVPLVLGRRSLERLEL